MHRLTLAVLAALTACAAPGPRESFRDAGLGLYSNAVFETPRLAGHWLQVAAFAAPNAAACRAGVADFVPQGDHFILNASLCLSGRSIRYSGVVTFGNGGSHAGRLLLSGADPAGIGQPWWVLWVDTDYRTMAIGTPSGSFGFILNRSATLPPDRLNAARDVFGWNGYDTTRLRLLN